MHAAQGRQTRHRWWFKLVSIALLAASMGLVGMALRPLVMWGLSASWVPVKATLVDVQLTALDTAEQRLHRRQARYEREVIFRYEMGGQNWISSNWGWDRLASSTTNLQSAEAVFSRFNGLIGEPTTAWVNPRNPAQAVLVRQPFWVGVMFWLGLGAAAFLFYLVGQLLTSLPDEAARFTRLAKAALLMVNLTVVIFMAALVLDNYLSGRPHWGVALLCGGFAAFWLWAMRQLTVLQRQGKPMVSWHEWRAKLPAFVNPHTLRNELLPPAPWDAASVQLVPTRVLRLAALVAVGSHVYFTTGWLNEGRAQATQFTVDSLGRQSQFLRLASLGPTSWVQTEVQLEAATTRNFETLHVVAPPMQLRLRQPCGEPCGEAMSYEYMLAVRRGGSYCGVVFSGLQSLLLEPAAGLPGTWVGNTKPHAMPIARSLVPPGQAVWLVLVLHDSQGQSLFLHADAALDLGHAVDAGLIGPGTAVSVAHSREQRKSLYCPA